MIIKKEVEIGGKIFSIETGRYAKQANGAVMVRYADTMVLVTAVAAEEAKIIKTSFLCKSNIKKELRLQENFQVVILKEKGGLLKKRY